MLRGRGDVRLLLTFRRWICVCVRDAELDERLRAGLKTWCFAGMTCWCDRRDRAAAESQSDA